MSDEKRIALERQGHVALLTLGRPGHVNPLDTRLMEELAAAVDEVQADPEIRCLVITGQDSAFAAGADLKNVIEIGVEENLAYGRHMRRTFDRIASLPIPVIAAINGHALGGGLEIALACSIRYCADDLVLGLPEVKLGLIASAGGVQRLVRAINRGPAIEMMVSGRFVRPDEALRLGLVDRVLPGDELLEAATELARKIAANSPAAVRAVIELVQAGVDQPLADAQDETDSASARVLATGEYLEGVGAFLEKRKPEFGAAEQEGTGN